MNIGESIPNEQPRKEQRQTGLRKKRAVPSRNTDSHESQAGKRSKAQPVISTAGDPHIFSNVNHSPEFSSNFSAKDAGKA